MKRLGVFVLLLAISGCSGAASAPAPTPTTFDVKGTLTLGRVMLYAIDGDDCSGTGGYDDIRTGTQVKVSDDTGKIVGLGALKKGLARQTISGQKGTNKCVFDFEVKDVPLDGGSIYGVEVSHRGVIQFTRDQADQIALTLG